jgi:putative N6-adenine-specific DNA methylase
VSFSAERGTLFLPCAAGVEALLADEVRALLGDAAVGLRAARGGVALDTDVRGAMRLNLESRLAQRVLWQLAEGPYRDEHDIFDLARRVRWTDWITPRQTLRVDATAQRSPLQSLHFAGLRVKDAVCDTLREQIGARPSVDVRAPDLPLALHAGPERAAIHVDLSGEPLFKRGWREDKGEAPLKETLAAAMLAAAGWRGRADDGPLFDPCCGAGTIAIEAAQMACGIAPGLLRRFAFERLAPFRDHADTWLALKAQAQDRRHAPVVPVFAGDVAFRMTDFATRNAMRAGVAEAVAFKTADALQRLPPAPAGTLMLNPPYGERIEAGGTGRATREGADGGGDIAAFYAALAAHWKRHYAGWTAWVLSPDPRLPSALRLKESRRVPLWNGPLECRLFRFDLVAGSARAAAAPPPPDAG